MLKDGRGIGIAAVPQLPKLVTGVQLPYPAFYDYR